MLKKKKPHSLLIVTAIAVAIMATVLFLNQRSELFSTSITSTIGNFRITVGHSYSYASVRPVIIPDADPHTNPSVDDFYYFFERDDRVRITVTALTGLGPLINQSTGNAYGTISSISTDGLTAHIDDYGRNLIQWGIIGSHGYGKYNQFVLGNPSCRWNGVNIQRECDNTNGVFSPRIFLKLKELEIIDSMVISSYSTNTLMLNEEIPPNGTSPDGVKTGVYLEPLGGMPPYQFSIISGQLPPGVTLNPLTGDTTGAPTQQGAYSAGVKLTDSHLTSEFGIEAEKNITLNVAERTPLVATVSDFIVLVRDYGRATVNPQGGAAPYTYTSGNNLSHFNVRVYRGGVPAGRSSIIGKAEEVVTITDFYGVTKAVPITYTVYNRYSVNFLPYKRLQDNEPALKYYLKQGEDYTAAPFVIPIAGPKTHNGSSGFQIRLADAQNSPLNLPAGLTLNTNNGTLTGSTATVGEYENNLIAIDDVQQGETDPTIVFFVVTTDPPIARDDVYQTEEDTPFTTDPGSGILENDEQFSSFTGILNIVTDPANAESFSMNTDGTFTYHPRRNFNGTDTFSYRLVNGAVRSEVANVTIQVQSVNDQPVAISRSITGFREDLRGGVIDISANDADNDTLQFIIPTATESGATLENITVTNSGYGRRMSYALPQDYNGTDRFQFIVDDGQREPNSVSDPATITVEVLPENDNPVAVDDVVVLEWSVIASPPIRIDPLENDYDVDGDELIVYDFPFSSFNAPNEFTILSNRLNIVNNGRTIEYTPAEIERSRLLNGESGKFIYNAWDHVSIVSTGRGTITITKKEDHDLNLDGVTDTRDIVDLITSVKRGPNETAQRRRRADINGDSNIDLSDVIEMIKRILARQNP